MPPHQSVFGPSDNAVRNNQVSVDELHRWAERSAREFTDHLAVADAGRSITAWTDQLHRARTAAEFQAVAEAVVGDGNSGLGALHQFLETAAEWCERHQEPGIADHYRVYARRLASLGEHLTDLGEDHLLDAYRRAHRPPQPPRPAPPGATPLRRPTR
ncbi:hypothetical protein DMH18_26340 [Streptomyces sp. WAC 06783]|uniref:hypothetical protein n=1 Tax=Streptomyces sp. WAC 06783 TaxID=2203211 RepID=UPI000F744529|nr:hypothetical protein [Streptomyces sp. WAC 06783]RSO06967.1 hypothetical protein DMH18_26340 [Streptomyces sp. WAC 06783]